jgi:hypothetical protein
MCPKKYIPQILEGVIPGHAASETVAMGNEKITSTAIVT